MGRLPRLPQMRPKQRLRPPTRLRSLHHRSRIPLPPHQVQPLLLGRRSKQGKGSWRHARKQDTREEPRGIRRWCSRQSLLRALENQRSLLPQPTLRLDHILRTNKSPTLRHLPLRTRPPLPRLRTNQSLHHLRRTMGPSRRKPTRAHSAGDKPQSSRRNRHGKPRPAPTRRRQPVQRLPPNLQLPTTSTHRRNRPRPIRRNRNHRTNSTTTRHGLRRNRPQRRIPRTRKGANRRTATMVDSPTEVQVAKKKRQATTTVLLTQLKSHIV